MRSGVIARTIVLDKLVNAFLAAHAEFRLERLPFAESGMLQLLPEVHGTDGFFVARMRRCI